MAAKKKIHEYSSLPKSHTHSYMPGEHIEKAIATGIGATVGVSLGLATIGVLGGLLKK